MLFVCDWLLLLPFLARTHTKNRYLISMKLSLLNKNKINVHYYPLTSSVLSGLKRRCNFKRTQYPFCKICHITLSNPFIIFIMWHAENLLLICLPSLWRKKRSLHWFKSMSVSAITQQQFMWWLKHDLQHFLSYSTTIIWWIPVCSDLTGCVGAPGKCGLESARGWWSELWLCVLSQTC